MTLKEIDSMSISYNDLDKLPPEYLIKIDKYGYKSWVVGKPINPPLWKLKVLSNNMGIIPTIVHIYATDEIEAIPPQDIVKYINDLTEAGTEYLKNLKL